MEKTLKNRMNKESDSDEEEENTSSDPVLIHEIVPHKGGVNRLKSLHGSHIVATWNDEAEVGIYDVKQAVRSLEARSLSGKLGKEKKFGGCKVAGFKHT